MHTVIEPLLKIGDVARLLNVSQSSAYRLIKSGAIPQVKVPGSLVRVRLADLERLMASTADKEVENDLEKTSEASEQRP